VKGYVRPRAVTVPRRAIVQSPSGAVVLLVDPSNVAQPRPVTLGEWIESDVVVLSGLAEGDRIITDGLQRVAPGMKITVAASGPTEGSASGSTKPDRR